MANRVPLYLDFRKGHIKHFDRGDALDSAVINGAVPAGGTTGQVLKKINADDYNLQWGTIAGGGDMLAANNLSDVVSAVTARTNLGINTTANQTDSANKRFITDAQEANLDNQSGVNTGDNTNFAPPLGADDNYATDAEKIKLSNLSGTNSGDQTSIVGITGTKAQFNTAVTDGNIMYTGDAPTAHTHPESEITNLVTDLAAKQATLVSATNIKTVNGSSVLGSGDLVIAAAASFSGITGQPTDNVNLSTALAGKANVTTIGIPVYSRVTGSNVITTGQALVDITGLLNALVANATYEFEAVLSVSTSAVTTGTAYGVNFSAAGATIEAHITGSSTSTASKTLRINALNTATLLFLATSAQTGGIVIKGIVTTGANAGNFTIKHLKLTSGTSTVFINSYLKTVRIL